jgi:hypothetical protein
MALHTDDRPVYVYGVVRGGERTFEVEGVGSPPAQVRTVPVGELAAVVSDAPDDLGAAGRRDIEAHARVLGHVMETRTVVPFRFGTVLPGAEGVAGALGPTQEHLDSLLADLDGYVEVDLRVTYDEEAVLREIVEHDAAVRRARSRTRRSVHDSIELGQVVAGAVDDRRHRDARSILDRLSPLAAATSEGELLIEQMVLNAAFLVAADELGNFDRAVDEAGRDYGDLARFQYFGPLPPYSFSSVELGRA